ncbi:MULTISPECIES: pentapeptide repeat-containing protein [Legionella]|uniref:IcmE/DotG protein n=1 Tax=Legionella drozanskii LLAP-1 TaxID=1212489 RepID=A0A0W0SRT7_9GAMM|nr:MULTISPECIES: pentapeptide repeat-containing protein [Legionella]KTC86003.1 IcmE/DotG protein [Legionella drozanskii LLAP-1]PJE09904.1 MAG: pentapeptide repeat-containing protein [Legionella sp.]
MITFLRPLLGLIQGVAAYFIITKAHLSIAGTVCALIVFTFPLLALQIKLPSKKTLFLGLTILILMGLIYGFAAYHLMETLQTSSGFLAFLLAVQCGVSLFIFFVFYCVIVEEGDFHFPYSSLFSESWQILLKLFFAKLLVSLTWGLFILAAKLFELLNITIISNLVFSKPFTYILPPLFFGVAMAILYHFEDILTKLRNILLAFCQFLYPIFVVISLSFLLILPFAHKDFADFWLVIVGLSIINILLFNGIFQASSTQSPYPRWFSIVVYASFILITIYSFYILKFPLLEIQNYGFKPQVFLLFLLLAFIFAYHFWYSLAIFFSSKPWLSMIKNANTIMAFVIGLIYLILALPLINIGKISSKLQLSRLLNKQDIINPNNPFNSQGYLVGANLKNANLEGRDLRNINFSNANLQGANLVKANLRNADLSQANLIDANLNSANLQYVNFKEANLTQAKLANTNLTFSKFDKTNLIMTNFAGANLQHAWFNQVVFQNTNFTNADLRNSYGLTQEELNNACGGMVTLPEKLSISPCPRE